MIHYLSTSTLRAVLVTLQEALTIRAYARRIAPLERKLEQVAALFFRAQGRAFGPSVDLYFGLREASELGDLDQLFDDSVAKIDIGALAKAIGESYVAGALAGIGDYALGINFDLKNPRAVAYFNERGLELLKELNDTTKADIAKIIANGLENGTSYQELARAIKRQFVAYAAKERGKQSRAEKVAVTEVGRAYQSGNYGAILEASGTGLDFEKSWLAVKDPCPICESNAAQGWIAFGAQHSSADQHPPAHPTCRCAELYQRREAAKRVGAAPAPTTRKRAVRAPKPAPDLPKVPAPKPVAVAKPKKPFNLNDLAGVTAIDEQLRALYPDSSSFWNKQVNYDANMRPVGLYNPNNGQVSINSNYTNAKDQRFRDEAFKAIVHELLHGRSKGVRDTHVEGVGWEEAIIEANAQLQTEKIAKSVGYSSKELAKYYKDHPYVAKWITPLDNTLKDLKLDRESFYTSMLTKTCEERKDYIRSALVKKYGKNEGRTRMLALSKALE